jgi:hypothetical protein
VTEYQFVELYLKGIETNQGLHTANFYIESVEHYLKGIETYQEIANTCCY